MDSMNVFFVLLVFAVAAWFVSTVIKGYKSADAPKTHVCPNCRSVVNPTLVTPGSTILEILLWLCFLLPGILYTAYCHANKRRVCPVCGAQNPVPLATPAGQALTKAAILVLICLLFASRAVFAQSATVTIYSPSGFKVHAKQGLTLGIGSGQEEFRGAIYEGDRKVGLFVGARFLTFTVPSGKHVFDVSDHQNRNTPKVEVAINAEPGKSYFVRASETHKGAYIVQAFHWSLTEVTCAEARTEADTLKPLDIKKVGKEQRETLVNAAYFPSCAKLEP